MNGELADRTRQGLSREIAPPVAAFGEMLAHEFDALAVLFYGSNLRTGELDGVLDFYVLLPGDAEKGIWPRVSYHEWQFDKTPLRAKVAAMSLRKFGQAAAGETLDTTIWARFAQPCVLVWHADEEARDAVHAAVAKAAITASRLACALGPDKGREEEFWIALFEATYKAEFRIETKARAHSIFDLNRAHFDGLLPAALDAGAIAWNPDQQAIVPQIDAPERRRIKRWWNRRRRLGKMINLIRLVRAAFTFEGAARYAAWKIERHTGIPVEVTPWRERHPVLAAPGVLMSLWLRRRKRG